MSSIVKAEKALGSVSVENYLKEIYHGQSDGTERVKTKELADRLGISLPSVTGMLKSLAEEGLVDYEPYRGVRLTARGRRIALRVIRNHRLIESFLCEALGFSWDEVHAEAEVLEHAASDKLIERIDRYLGFPACDPHGDPIPTAEGKMGRGGEGTSLLTVKPGAPVRITRVLDQQPEVLRYLNELGLAIGSEVKVLEVMPFDGPLRLSCKSGVQTISRSLASRLVVTG